MRSRSRIHLKKDFKCEEDIKIKINIKGNIKGILYITNKTIKTPISRDYPWLGLAVKVRPNMPHERA
jgi:hypothetical protein